MERRPLSHLALIVSGAAVLVALGVLLVEIRSGAREPAEPSAELASAVAGGRAQKGPASSPPAGAAAPQVPPAARAAAHAEREAPRLGAGRSAEAPPAPAQQQESFREAIELYDRGEYEEARTAAIEALKLGLDPMATDRMQCIAAAASCFLGDQDQARVWYQQLIPASRPDIAKRCRRVGIEL